MPSEIWLSIPLLELAKTILQVDMIRLGLAKKHTRTLVILTAKFAITGAFVRVVKVIES
jgi:hypothetical protein